MAAIKRFFEKAKLDKKFKKAGPGQRLDTDTVEETQRGAHGRPQPQPKPASSGGKPGDERQRAAAAALAREQQYVQPTMSNRSLNLIRAEARKRLEEEEGGGVRRQEESQASSQVRRSGDPLVQDAAPMLAVTGVYFSCPLVGPDILPKVEMEALIRKFLYEQLEEEQALTSCLIIQTCNNREKAAACTEILTKCLENIIQNPTEEKFRKLRTTTKTFQDKISGVEGGVEFLLGAGFVQRRLPYNDTEDDFYVFPEEGDLESLSVLLDALRSAHPIVPELDRNMRVLSPSSKTVQNQRIELPPEFYQVTAEEARREMQLRQERVEKNQMLMTKEMREQQRIKERRVYRYALIRIRFPDGLILQGTFHSYEPQTHLFEFVRENLRSPNRAFRLTTATGQRLTDDDQSLTSAGLVPAAIVHFAWAGSPETKRSSPAPDVFLCNETLAFLQPD